jgi:hypothetical protein
MPSSSDSPWWQRYRTEVIVVLVGLVVVVGLYARNRSDDDGTSTRDPSATTTVAPEEARGGTDGDGEEAPVVPATTGEGASTLAEAVLRAKDLPQGWTAARVNGGLGALCPGRDPFARIPAAASARAAFTEGGSGRIASGSVARFRSATEAGSLLAGVREDAGACVVAGTTFTASTLSGVGDEALKLTIVAGSGSGIGSYRTLITLARVGEHVALVAIAGEPDEALAVRALKAELGRL